MKNDVVDNQATGFGENDLLKIRVLIDQALNHSTNNILWEMNEWQTSVLQFYSNFLAAVISDISANRTHDLHINRVLLSIIF